MKFVPAFTVMFVVSASAACAADPVAPADSAKTLAATKAVADPNRLICQTIDVIGSRIQTKRICVTAAQWKEQQFHNNQWAEHQQTYNSGLSGGR